MRSSLLLACGLLGCVSFPKAELLQGQAALEVVRAPVVCGPVGFRKVPLQSRWGEYVRVTVSSQSELRGAVLVHAGGVAQEPRSWSTGSTGALVIEARFPNEDVDRLFALGRERPIDITLTGLEGVCEGAVFTVEHGALVPSIDERAWIAELERRGGPELAARREVARLAADERRQAHYALWEGRQVTPSAELLARAELVRQQHYAQFPRPRGGEGQGEGAIVLASTDTPNSIAVPELGLPEGGEGLRLCVPGTCAGPAFEGTAAKGSPHASLTSLPLPEGGEGRGEGLRLCASGTCAGPAFEGTAATSAQGTTSSCATSPTDWAHPADLSLRATVEVATVQPPLALQPSAPILAVTSQGEWNQPTDLSLRATGEFSSGSPADPSLAATGTIDSNWSQPFDAHLEPVAVTTESRVAVRSPEAAPVCTGDCAQREDHVLTVLVPSLFQMMFNVAASAPAAPIRQGQHAARPLGR